MAGQVATTIDWRHGSNATPTVLVDLSTKANDVDFPREQSMKDITPFAASGNAKQFAVGLNSSTFKVQYFWDATIDAQLDALINPTAGLPVNFQYGPIGTTTGNPKYSGSMYVKSIGRPVKVDDVMMMTVEYQVTSAVVRATY